MKSSDTEGHSKQQEGQVQRHTGTEHDKFTGWQSSGVPGGLGDLGEPERWHKRRLEG